MVAGTKKPAVKKAAATKASAAPAVKKTADAAAWPFPAAATKTPVAASKASVAKAPAAASKTPAVAAKAPVAKTPAVATKAPVAKAPAVAAKAPAAKPVAEKKAPVKAAAKPALNKLWRNPRLRNATAWSKRQLITLLNVPILRVVKPNIGLKPSARLQKSWANNFSQ